MKRNPAASLHFESSHLFFRLYTDENPMIVISLIITILSILKYTWKFTYMYTKVEHTCHEPIDQLRRFKLIGIISSLFCMEGW